MKTIACLLAAQNDEATRAVDMLKGLAEALKKTPSISFELVEQGGDGVQAECLLKRPNFLRLKASRKGNVLGELVLDGQTAWSLAENRFTKSPDAATMLKTIQADIVILHLFFASKPPEGTEFLLKKEKLGEEDLNVVGWKAGQGSFRLWIDGEGTIRQMSKKAREGAKEETLRVDKLQAAKPADDAFVFKPPEGAKEEKGEDEGLVAAGAAAPEFEGTGIDGGTIKLSSYRGKPVLLNFWFYG